MAVASFQHETCTFCPGGDVTADDWRGRLTADEVLRSGAYVRGFVSQANDYGDMVAKGIIDPTKVTRTALENAGSVASMILTAQTLISEEHEEKPDHHGHVH